MSCSIILNYRALSTVMTAHSNITILIINGLLLWLCCYFKMKKKFKTKSGVFYA